MNRYGKVEEITKIERIDEDFSYCKVRIDMDVYYAFYNYSELLSMVGQRVEYNTRDDVVKGERVRLIAQVIDKRVVQVVPGGEFSRLFPINDTFRPVCNFKVKEIKFGDTHYDCVGFLSGFTEGSSKKAKWLDCVIVDANSIVFNLRIFVSALGEEARDINLIKDMVGYYVKFNISSTAYGYQTDLLTVCSDEVIVPPEVEIAIRRLNAAIVLDQQLQEYIATSKLFERLRGLIYYEIGYHLVEMAMEMYLVNALDDISTSYDTDVLRRAVVMSRCHLLPAKANYSVDILNVVNTLKSKLSSDTKLLVILDSRSKDELPEKTIYKMIQRFTKKVLEERRGINNDEKIGPFIASMYAAIDELL